MTSNKSIRPVVPSDLLALKGVIDSSELFPGELLNDMITPFFKGEDRRGFWLTFDDGQPVCVAYCAPEKMTVGTWNLLLIAVHADHQGKGIGARMMMYIEQKLAMQGERILLVETSGDDSFERTRAFYKKNGYTQEARVREFYQPGEDKIVYWKQLQVLSIKR